MTSRVLAPGETFREGDYFELGLATYVRGADEMWRVDFTRSPSGPGGCMPDRYVYKGCFLNGWKVYRPSVSGDSEGVVEAEIVTCGAHAGEVVIFRPESDDRKSFVLVPLGEDASLPPVFQVGLRTFRLTEVV